MQSTYNPFLKPLEEIHSRMLTEEELERGKKHYMSSSYPTHFTIFRAVPKLHAIAARVLKCVEKEELTVKGAINRLQLVSLDKTEQYFISCAERFGKVIDYLLKKSSILQDHPFFDIYTVKVFIGQLLWGNQSIPLGTMETTNLLYYEADLKETFVEADTVLHDTYVSNLPVYVRVNTLAISLEQCINAFFKEGWRLLEYQNDYSHYLSTISRLQQKEFVRDIHISELLVFPPGTSFYNHPGYLKGKFVLQDKGSCLASFLLNPKPGSIVLDMCAAPGKTTNHLANIINNQGTVYAVENHPHRYNKLHSFLKLTDVKCAETIWSDNLLINIDNVNYVLIDGASTYTGIFYKRIRIGLGRRLKQYFHASSKSLIYALQTFQTAKRIVFSSCTSFPEEGEKIVKAALARVGNSYNLLDVKELLWNEWISTGITEHLGTGYPFANKCLRTNPNTDKCFGYFIAVFERNFEVPIPTYPKRKRKKPKGDNKFDEDESDDEFSDDNDNEIPKTTVTPLFKKPMETQFVKKPTQFQFFKKPVAATRLKKPMAALLKTPIETQFVNKPMSAPLLKTPMETQFVKKPMSAPLLKTPMETQFVKKPMAAPLLKTPMAAPLLKTPITTPLLKTPIATPTQFVQKPVSAPLLKTPIKTPLLETPIATQFVKNPMMIQFVRNPTASSFSRTSERKLVYETLKAYPTKIIQNYKPHPYLPNPQNNISANQTHIVSYPCSRPYNKTEHSQLYP